MASTVPFKLISPTRVVFQGDAELVIAVTTEGEEGILPKHAPFLAALRPGVLRANVVADGASRRLELATGEGFMQALPDRITVLVDDALAFDDVDVARAREDLAAATERQKAEPIESAAFAREQAAIDFASAKLRLTGH
ncbi:MAG: ATP synthase F1 subunit epsilon [Candidatus Eremiobacteraeota bacterium]|nr:ATP synthase F1 subunit epsilon [Candidatus Eremiobacteraeota bacterium]